MFSSMKKFVEKIKKSITGMHQDDAKEIIEAFQDSEKNILNESLNVKEVEFINSIGKRIENLIKVSVLASFIEIRRQIKAIQRELADYRKQYDKNQKEISSDIKEIKIQLSKIEKEQRINILSALKEYDKDK